MESDPLKSPVTSEDKWLQDVFRDAPPLQDAGFSARVMSALPRQARSTWLAVRGTDLLTGLVLLAALVGTLGRQIDAAFPLLLSTLERVSTALTNPYICIAAVVCCFCVYFTATAETA